MKFLQGMVFFVTVCFALSFAADQADRHFFGSYDSPESYDNMPLSMIEKDMIIILAYALDGCSQESVLDRLTTILFFDEHHFFSGEVDLIYSFYRDQVVPFLADVAAWRQQCSGYDEERKKEAAALFFQQKKFNLFHDHLQDAITWLMA